MQDETILIVTDGACLGNPGPGGWAAIVRQSQAEELLVGSEPDTTNNRMEMTAVIEGLKAVPPGAKVRVKSDSKYTIDAFRQNWLKNWKANNWRTAAKKPVKNKDLWLKLVELVESCDVSWEWVKGHSGDPDNEKVDQAARQAAEQLGL